MSTLLARIMLALLMLPLGVLIYVAAIFTAMEFDLVRGDELAFFVADLVTAIFIAAYWIFLWRRTVPWTRPRIRATCGVTVLVLVVGAVVGRIGGAMDDGFGIFIGGISAIVLWLVGTTLAWRESAEERRERIKRQGGTAVACPTCAYNMTGLTSTVCPECGTRFTVEELLASQPARAAEELEL